MQCNIRVCGKKYYSGIQRLLFQLDTTLPGVEPKLFIAQIIRRYADISH